MERVRHEPCWCWMCQQLTPIPPIWRPGDFRSTEYRLTSPTLEQPVVAHTNTPPGIWPSVENQPTAEESTRALDNSFCSDISTNDADRHLEESIENVIRRSIDLQAEEDVTPNTSRHRQPVSHSTPTEFITSSGRENSSSHTSSIPSSISAHSSDMDTTPTPRADEVQINGTVNDSEVRFVFCTKDEQIVSCLNARRF